MKGLAALWLLMAVLAAANAAPAGAQERLPRDLWDPVAPQAAPAADRESVSVSALLLTVLALGAAALAGFLVTGVRQVPPAPAAAPAADAPPPDAPVPDAPVPDAPPPDAPVPDAPAPDAPVPDAPAPDAPVPDAPAPDAPAARPGPPRLEGCSIVLARSRRTSQFRVVVGKGVERRVVGRSQRFPSPPTGRIPDTGPARAAFDELMARLKTVGWTAIGPESDVWHKIQLVRARQDESALRVERAVVDAVGDGLAAFALDDYGNRQPLAERAVTVDRPPLDAHAELVAELESDGWQVEGDGAPWFATTLTRRALRSAP